MATVSGYVEKIKYRNEENGYSILSVNSDGLDYVLVGTFPYISEGDFIEASGRDVEHPIYGDQIQVESYELKAPEDTASMERYLGSGAIRGVGTALAARIVRRFKADTFRIIEEEPERLAEVKGISEKMAQAISEQMESKKEMRQAMMFLQEYGISMSLALKIYNEYGSRMYSIIKENPYRLADDIQGVGFKMADEIAQKVGIFTDSDFRIRSGIYYTLLQSVANGHTYLPQEELLASASELLHVDPAVMEKHLTDLQMEKKIVVKVNEEKLLKPEEDDSTPASRHVYASQYYYTELNTARMLHDLNLRGAEPKKPRTDLDSNGHCDHRQTADQDLMAEFNLKGFQNAGRKRDIQYQIRKQRLAAVALGPYFISRSIVVPEEGDMIDNDRFMKTFKSKVIMYLFEDAAKQKRSAIFEGCFENSTRYSEICKEFDEKGIDIFNREIQMESEPEDLLEKHEE